MHGFLPTRSPFGSPHTVAARRSRHPRGEHAALMPRLRFAPSIRDREAAMAILSFFKPHWGDCRRTGFDALPSEGRWTDPQAWRRGEGPRFGRENPSARSGLVWIAAATIARSLDLNETSQHASCQAGAPTHHPQSIGPVR